MALLARGKLVAFAAATAVIFGVATIAAGSRVLGGSDPGYVVFRPLLLFNTAMGIAYIVVGLLAWQRRGSAVYGAGSIAALNVTVLGGIALLYSAGLPIATNSLNAMAFRTIVWVSLFVVLLWARRQASSEGRDAV